MLKQLLLISISIPLIMFTACGSGGSSSNQESSNPEEIDTSSTQNSLKGIELYEATLTQVNGSRQYNIKKFDGITSTLTPLTYNLDLKDFNPQNQDQEIFVNGQRNSFSNINYEVNQSGKLIASANNQKIYSLSLLSTEDVKKTYFDEYRSNIGIEGKAYQIETNYLSNFYLVEKLFSSTVFDNIETFTTNYQNKVFRGNYFKGLVFSDDNKLKELKDGNYSDAGTYEIKTLNNIDILMIYPTDTNYYYAENSCYILSFSRIWQSKCYLKDTKETQSFYDKDVYDDLESYLKEKFVSINISI